MDIQNLLIKIVELGREDVNKYNIYIKFGCMKITLTKPQHHISSSKAKV